MISDSCYIHIQLHSQAFNLFQTHHRNRIPVTFLSPEYYSGAEPALARRTVRSFRIRTSGRTTSVRWLRPAALRGLVLHLPQRDPANHQTTATAIHSLRPLCSPKDTRTVLSSPPRRLCARRLFGAPFPLHPTIRRDCCIRPEALSAELP